MLEVRWARAVNQGQAPAGAAPTPRAPPAASGCPHPNWAGDRGLGEASPWGPRWASQGSDLPLSTLLWPGLHGTTTSLTYITCAWSWRKQPRPTAMPCVLASTPSSLRTSVGGAMHKWHPSRWAWPCPVPGLGFKCPVWLAEWGGPAPEVTELGWKWPGRGDPNCPRCPPPAQDRGEAERDLS